jgi:hypothetical protein
MFLGTTTYVGQVKEYGEMVPVLLAARSKAWVCARSLAGIAGSNPDVAIDVLSLVSVVCCQVEVPATGRSLFQRSTIECGVSECDRRTSAM